MDCLQVELTLSDYLEANLPDDQRDQIAKHLETCPSCSALFREMQFIISQCQSYPTLNVDPGFIERILLHTSGHPRTRTFRESFSQYVIRPLLTPRLAVGTSLAALFLILMFDVMMPKLSVTISSLSPAGLFQLMDRGVQQLYGEGLKIHERKNAWQAELNRLKNNAFNELRFMMEQVDVPVEGRRKLEESQPPKENAPKNQSSSLPLLSV
ncbi:MAG: zf-HC2 domain-containing protein [Acidobacteria bacterium]|nr:zf-HC2 domain-containing protein [Acidobacteriota bacterium]